MSTGWFLVPYVEGQDMGKRVRTLAAIQALTPEIHAADGYWSEAEIDGDRALVKVRAPAALMPRISAGLTAVADPAVLWTPQRTAEGRLFSNTPLSVVDDAVWSDARLAERKSVVDRLCHQADRAGYVRLQESWGPRAAALLAMAGRRGYGLDRISTGTFPTTSVLTSFTGADEDPLSEGGNWLGPSQSGTRRHKRFGNQATRSDIGAAGSWTSYLSPTQYGPDAEAFSTIATLPAATGSTGVWVRLHNPGNASTAEAYTAPYTVGTGFRLFRFMNGATYTQLGTTNATAASAGDKIGLEAIGTTISVYHFSGGSWFLRVTATDPNVTGVGYIGMDGDNDITQRIDDFGGGTVVDLVGTWTSFPRRGLAQVA